MANLVDQRLGNYRLLGLIGQGGFADVYLADHLHLGTRAAIKVLQMRVGSTDVEQSHGQRDGWTYLILVPTAQSTIPIGMATGMVAMIVLIKLRTSCLLISSRYKMFFNGFDKHIHIEGLLKKVICTTYIGEPACVRMG